MMIKKARKLIASLALLTLMAPLAYGQSKDDSQLEWWRDARFGMFIHWGLYSVQGGEWKGKDYGKEQGGASAEWLMNSANIPKEEYRNTLAPKFNPTQFDAAKWVSTATEAGMKYMVITSKHHEGFCLFDTEATDYNVMDATPFNRDIVKELSEECAKQGIRFGVYYSQFKDWYHRGRGRNNPGTLSTEEYLELVEKNLDELLSNYGEMAVLWFDTGGNDVIEADAQGARVRELQPNAVICSRLYSRRVPVEQRKYADFESLPDRMLPTKRMTEDAETCMTMRHNWGYDRTDDAWKIPKDIIEFWRCAAHGE
jgi:alpha-L-fucosidase